MYILYNPDLLILIYNFESTCANMLIRVTSIFAIMGNLYFIFMSFYLLSFLGYTVIICHNR